MNLLRLSNAYYWLYNWLNDYFKIMSNVDNELNDDLYFEETDIIVTPSPKPKKEKQVSMCIDDLIVDHYKLMLWLYIYIYIDDCLKTDSI